MDYFTVLRPYKYLQLLTLKIILSLDPEPDGRWKSGLHKSLNSPTAQTGTQSRRLQPGCRLHEAVMLSVRKTQLLGR